MPYEQKPKEDVNISHAEGKTEQQKEEFSFLQETIKPKTLSRERLFAQIARIAIYGVFFGIFACCGFYALKPWAETTFQKDAEKVTIQAEEEVPPEEESSAQEVIEEQKLTAEDYETLMQDLGKVAQEAGKCIVSIRSSRADDWTDGKVTGKGTTGVIAADNGREVLMFADNAVCADASEWTVTFSDKSEYKAVLKKQDKNRGLAVFSIERAKLDSSTWNAVKTATFGHFNCAFKGETVIALGNILHCEDGLSYGIISSKASEDIFADCQCRVITTDIPLAENGTGVLLNLKGEVLGLIRDRVGADAENRTASALAITDIKSVMELLLNGESVPYVGLNGVTVTSDISESQEIPEGMYVTQVYPDSPAMAAGIQNGDVIQEVNGMTVNGNEAFEKAVTECHAGAEVKIRAQRRGAGGYVNVNFMVTVGSRE